MRYPKDLTRYIVASRILPLRAIPFEYTWGGGGGGERSPIKKSWGEGVKMKKNQWARGLSNIEKHGAGGGGGGGGGLPDKKNNIGCVVYTIYTEKSQVGCQDTAIK